MHYCEYNTRLTINCSVQTANMLGDCLFAVPAAESTATTTYSRNFTVTRTGGLFGVVSAVWNVTDGLQFGDDLEPSSGTVTFADQQATASFTISSKQDEVQTELMSLLFVACCPCALKLVSWLLGCLLACICS